MNTYEVRFNRSTFAASTIEEAEAQAYDLLDAACPFEAKIVEIGDDGEFVRTVKTLGPANAKPTNQNKMKTQFAVKYELANRHTGRVHDTLQSAVLDLAKCQKDAGAGLGDQQGITLVAVELDSFRELTDAEDNQLFAICGQLDFPTHVGMARHSASGSA